MTRTFTHFCLLLTLLPSPLTLAQPLRFDSNFYRISTNLDRDSALQVASHMDVVFGEYRRRFSQFRARDARLEQQKQSLYVFASQEDYLAFLASRQIDATGTGGMFFSNGQEAGLAAFLPRGDRDRMYQTLQHEGFHQFAAVRIGPNLPVWLNEGMAEYFSEAILVRSDLVAGLVPPARLKRVQAIVERGEHIPFDILLNLSSDDWRARVRQGDGGLQYDQSWSIVQFLVDGDPLYRAALYRYLELVATGRTSDQAFRTAFGTDRYDEFEAAWRDHVAALKPSAVKTAEHRLTFLGYGIRFLSERGVAIESLDQVKRDLRAVRFRMTQTVEPGVSIELDSADDENFQAPPTETGRGETSIAFEPPPPAAAQRPAAANNRRQPAQRRTTTNATPAPDDAAAPQPPADLGPPHVVIRGLDLTVRLLWEREGETTWASRIVFE